MASEPRLCASRGCRTCFVGFRVSGSGKSLHKTCLSPGESHPLRFRVSLSSAFGFGSMPARPSNGLFRDSPCAPRKPPRRKQKGGTKSMRQDRLAQRIKIRRLVIHESRSYGMASEPGLYASRGCRTASVSAFRARVNLIERRVQAPACPVRSRSGSRSPRPPASDPCPLDPPRAFSEIPPAPRGNLLLGEKKVQRSRNGEIGSPKGLK
jgi:hypothetical protein